MPVVFVHGMNSSPEAWGFQIDSSTENVTDYNSTVGELRNYFDDYLKQNPVTGAQLSYLEPFNYQFNTFDSIKWNSYEGYNDTQKQYPDERIDITKRFDRPTLYTYVYKTPIPPEDPIGGICSKYMARNVQLVAHSLGGLVSRDYLRGGYAYQLTTLGSPHRGSTVASIAELIVGKPVTDIQNIGMKKKIWLITFSPFLRGVSVNRYPVMLDELKRYSDFIRELNTDMPYWMKYYCIGGALNPIPGAPIGYTTMTLDLVKWMMTDGFISLDSALAGASGEQLPSSLEDIEGYKPKGYLPKYHGKLLTGWENRHTELPKKADEILKAIDNTTPVIQITEIKDSGGKIIWDRVNEYFNVPSDGRLTVHGECYYEYLPANTYINIGFRKAGETKIDWVTLSGGVTEEQADAGRWLLKPSDLWREGAAAVAEFEAGIDFPLNDVTHSIVLQATNPAGIKSEIAEVSEETWHFLACGLDNGGKTVILLIDAPTSFADGKAAMAGKFSLKDEEGNNITDKPLSISYFGSNRYALSFENNYVYRWWDTIFNLNNKIPTPTTPDAID
ncbi:MAG: hypothetical protein HY350_02095, partial [Candidatus Omnitrophica bacterium]|nr:hypothetical protein [Candidatus Omnitrophota bacterium]